MFFLLKTKNSVVTLYQGLQMGSSKSGALHSDNKKAGLARFSAAIHPACSASLSS